VVVGPLANSPLSSSTTVAVTKSLNSTDLASSIHQYKRRVSRPSALTHTDDDEVEQDIVQWTSPAGTPAASTASELASPAAQPRPSLQNKPPSGTVDTNSDPNPASKPQDEGSLATPKPQTPTHVPAVDLSRIVNLGQAQRLPPLVPEPSENSPRDRRKRDKFGRLGTVGGSSDAISSISQEKAKSGKIGQQAVSQSTLRRSLRAPSTSSPKVLPNSRHQGKSVSGSDAATMQSRTSLGTHDSHDLGWNSDSGEETFKVHDAAD